jgi:D-alanyl-lipoteichoic acid acyltransferase DltB (MBOAT superfamily)
MLFNSTAFLFIYLPVMLGIYVLLRPRGGILATLWLLIGSLVFYGWWEPRSLPILAASILLNFAFGTMIARSRGAGQLALAAAVAANLLALAYFKYAAFLVGSAVTILGTSWTVPMIDLPIGISFFTFTQIAYLVDVHRGRVKEADPLRYGLFVTYFPHLIAGPILHHAEMMPQFENRRPRDRSLDLAVGLCLLSVGLFKKVVVADTIASFSTPIFETFDKGWRVSPIEAWIGALAYTLQIYFDFSAYCDMALGISRMFGILLPINFLSPYKATSIVDFWRRWHITLSRFLRDYLYIPLGGNRHGPARRFLNLFATMMLGGLWHGASWNFVIWGSLHGAYLVVNHGFRALRPARGPPSRVGAVLSWLLTFVCVVSAWVFFRAETLRGATNMLKTMFGLRSSYGPATWSVGVLVLLATALAWCVLAPNIYDVMRRSGPGLYPESFAKGSPGPIGAWAPTLR